MTRAWRTSMGELKLNLGCGRNVLPRFVNIDTSPSVLLNRWPFAKKILFSIGLINREQFATTWRPNIMWREVSRGLPYPDNSVDKIYSSHLLEHLEQRRGEVLLREMCRVLKVGGFFAWSSPIWPFMLVDIFSTCPKMSRSDVNPTMNSSEISMGRTCRGRGMGRAIVTCTTGLRSGLSCMKLGLER